MTEEQLAAEAARALTGRADRERCLPLVCPGCGDAALAPLPLAHNARLSCLCGAVFYVSTANGRVTVTESEETSVTRQVAKTLMR